MKALVTGASGFIGSHLTELLIQEGYEVRAFVHYNSRGDLGWLEDIVGSESVEIIRGDIRDYDIVSTAVRHVDVVFHLAALVGIPFSYLSPDANFETNLRGSMNVFQAAKQNKTQRVIHTSTSEIYGTAQYVPIDEKHPVNPQSPYAASKASADHFALAFCRSFDLPVTIVRPFNTYGPRQSPRAVIPTIITQLLRKDCKEIKLGSLRPTRDLMYVKDTARGFLAASINEEAIGEVVNLGTGQETSIGELAEKVFMIMGKQISVKVDEKRVRPEKSEVYRLLCDATKAKELLGWEAKVSLSDGLQETIDWFRKRMIRVGKDEYHI